MISFLVYALWYIYPYSSGLPHLAIEFTMKAMGKIDHCQTTTEYNKMGIICILSGICYMHIEWDMLYAYWVGYAILFNQDELIGPWEISI